MQYNKQPPGVLPWGSGQENMVPPFNIDEDHVKRWKWIIVCAVESGYQVHIRYLVHTAY